MAFSAVAVSTLISDCQFLIDDSSVPTSTQLLRSLNEARNKIFSDHQTFSDEYSMSSLAHVTKYTLPDNVYDVKDVRFFTDTESQVEPLTLDQFKDLGVPVGSTSISNYYKQDRVLNFRDSPLPYNYTDTIAGALATAATSVVLTVGTEVLPSTGIITIDSEKIYYGAKTDLTKTLSSLVRGFSGTTDADHADLASVSCELATMAYRDTVKTSFSDTEVGIIYLTTGTTKLPYSGRMIVGTEVIGWGAKDDNEGCLMTLTRAMESTTAATHTALDPITHRDILVSYYKSPEDLTTASTLEVVFNPYYKALEYFACWQAKLHDLDDIQATGVNNQADRFYALYMTEKERLGLYMNIHSDGVLKVSVVE